MLQHCLIQTFPTRYFLIFIFISFFISPYLYFFNFLSFQKVKDWTNWSTKIWDREKSNVFWLFWSICSTMLFKKANFFLENFTFILKSITRKYLTSFQWFRGIPKEKGDIMWWYNPYPYSRIYMIILLEYEEKCPLSRSHGFLKPGTK